MIDSNLVQGTDFLLIRMNLNNTFKNRIPSREKRGADSVMPIFMDGSKTENGTVSGTFSDDLDFSEPLRLPNTCRVF